MKSSISIFCIFAMAYNMALASVGGTVYCIDKGVATAAAESEERCCPFEGAHSTSRITLLCECDLCIDVELVGDELVKANLSFKRIVVKGAPVTRWNAFNFNPSVRVEDSGQKWPLTQEPLAGAPSAFREYADTVQFRC